MLGQPVSMLIPEVVGFKLTGALPEGATATDLVLTVTQMLRKKGVVGKFVEFFGPGVGKLPLADRATIANMAPEYGATCGFFPIDEVTLDYLRLTGRDAERVALVEAYAKAQGMWRHDGAGRSDVHRHARAGPRDRGAVARGPEAAAGPRAARGGQAELRRRAGTRRWRQRPPTPVAGRGCGLSAEHGDVVIAAITSCTNTSNPGVMIAAGLVARRRSSGADSASPGSRRGSPRARGWSPSTGKADLQGYLEQVGFDLVGYGCTTCIGNSGPLPDPIADAITDGKLVVSAVLSGNRNFEGRSMPR